MLYKTLLKVTLAAVVATAIAGSGYAKSTINVGAETEIGNLTQVTTESTLEAFAAWCPDGNSILFVSDRFNGFGICKTPREGGPTSQITAAASSVDADLWPDVHPKDGSIVFSSSRSRGVFQIFTIMPGNRGLTQLTSVVNGAYNPSWSPDGQQIAFCSPDKQGTWYVWLMSKDGSSLRQITPGIHPRWSPDGGRLVYAKETQAASKSARNWDIYIANIDGSGITQITSEETQEFAPDWSPDGNWISYVTINDRVKVPISLKDHVSDINKMRNFEIWVKNVSVPGRAAVQLTRSSGRDLYPRWSPTGQQILFVSDRGGSLDVWCMTPNVVKEPEKTTALTTQ